MRKDNGRIVVLEGLDGCGKGAQIAALKIAFGADGDRRDVVYRDRRVIFTREPGGTEFAEEMRTLIKKRMGTLSARTQLFNFFAARSDHWERVILPALRRGDLVVIDRADASSFAFQIFGQSGAELEDFFWKARRLVYGEYGEYEPDLYFFIDVSPEERERRMQKAAFEAGREISDFDLRPPEFHERVRNGYIAFGEACKGRFVRIDGERPIQLVHRDIHESIDGIL